MTDNYFCIRHKNRRKHNQHFKLLFFKLNSHFETSNETSKYRKLNLLLINSIYLTISSLEMQRQPDRPKYTTFFLICIKKTTRKPSKVAAAKKFSPGVYVIDTTCFDERFLFHGIAGRHYFLYKFAVTFRFFQPQYCCFL